MDDEEPAVWGGKKREYISFGDELYYSCSKDAEVLYEWGGPSGSGVSSSPSKSELDDFGTRPEGVIILSDSKEKSRLIFKGSTSNNKHVLYEAQMTNFDSSACSRPGISVKVNQPAKSEDPSSSVSSSKRLEEGRDIAWIELKERD